MARVTVLGAGAWGTALAVMLARAGNTVTLAVRRSAQRRDIERDRENRLHLAGVSLPASIRFADDWLVAVRHADLIVMAVPSRFARASVTPIASAIPASATLVSVTKGIEEHSGLTMSQMLRELMPDCGRIAVLSGPGFAAEVARDLPAALVAASSDEQVAREVQGIFAVRRLRVYTSSDTIGVELGGAGKNVIAIAAGISDGLELGSSARAALITRGLAEMSRIAVTAGARAETMAGLAGLGDLVLTCTGELSRNRRAGLTLARGGQIHELADGEPVAEGISNARSIARLARRLGVSMPITEAVHRVLYERASARAMVDELLSRELKAEF